MALKMKKVGCKQLFTAGKQDLSLSAFKNEDENEKNKT